MCVFVKEIVFHCPLCLMYKLTNEHFKISLVNKEMQQHFSGSSSSFFTCNFIQALIMK